jgi:hypothetical protein
MVARSTAAARRDGSTRLWTAWRTAIRAAPAQCAARAPHGIDGMDKKSTWKHYGDVTARIARLGGPHGSAIWIQMGVPGSLPARFLRLEVAARHPPGETGGCRDQEGRQEGPRARGRGSRSLLGARVARSEPRRQFLGRHWHGREQRHRPARADHRESGGCPQDSRGVARTPMGGPRQRADPLCRIPGRPLGSFVWLPGGGIRLGGPSGMGGQGDVG